MFIDLNIDIKKEIFSFCYKNGSECIKDLIDKKIIKSKYPKYLDLIYGKNYFYVKNINNIFDISNYTKYTIYLVYDKNYYYNENKYNINYNKLNEDLDALIKNNQKNKNIDKNLKINYIIYKKPEKILEIENINIDTIKLNFKISLSKLIDGDYKYVCCQLCGEDAIKRARCSNRYIQLHSWVDNKEYYKNIEHEMDGFEIFNICDFCNNYYELDNIVFVIYNNIKYKIDSIQRGNS